MKPGNKVRPLLLGNVSAAMALVKQAVDSLAEVDDVRHLPLCKASAPCTEPLDGRDHEFAGMLLMDVIRQPPCHVTVVGDIVGPAFHAFRSLTSPLVCCFQVKSINVI